MLVLRRCGVAVLIVALAWLTTAGYARCDLCANFAFDLWLEPWARLWGVSGCESDGDFALLNVFGASLVLLSLFYLALVRVWRSA
jgi:disulfide bond formation protein DsbB